MKLVLAAMAASALLLSSGIDGASAHPLGNYTVNRATAVRVETTELRVRHVIDMAELRALAAISRMDANGDGSADQTERQAWAEATCGVAASALTVGLDGVEVPLTTKRQQLSLPPGVNGLDTVRLVCELDAPIDSSAEPASLTVEDASPGEPAGWREITIAGGSGVAVTESTVPSVSPSAELTAYPQTSLETPPEVRSARATIARGTSTVVPSGPTSPGAAIEAGYPLPLGALLRADLAPWLAVLLALALGVAHAASPGHGKALVAAYVVGTNGTPRQALTLGLTVAATHTVGVFVLGLVVLAAGEWILPDRFVAALSLGSGLLLTGLGLSLLRRAVTHGRNAPAHHRHHAHDHEHADPHTHPHPHAHGDAGPRLREFVALGLVGGMIPSVSALVVFLIAISTGRLLFGAVLIGAFGIGMALLLGGLAAGTAAVARTVRTRPNPLQRALGRRIGRLVPIGSAGAVAATGVVVMLGAVPGLI